MTPLENKIERYLAGEMSEEERQAFELQIEADPNLQRDLALYQEIDKMYDEQDWSISQQPSDQQRAYESQLQSEEQKRIAANIRKAEKQYFETAKKPVAKFSRLYFYAAASVALLILALAFFGGSDPNTAALFAEYKQWESLPSLTVRGEQSVMSRAEAYFVQGEYDEAARLLQSYFAANPDTINTTALIYLGASQLELNQTADAINTFTQLKESDTLDRDKADWYLALGYLKGGNLNDAKTILETITKTAGSYNRDQAAALLEEL